MIGKEKLERLSWPQVKNSGRRLRSLARPAKLGLDALKVLDFAVLYSAPQTFTNLVQWKELAYVDVHTLRIWRPSRESCGNMQTNAWHLKEPNGRWPELQRCTKALQVELVGKVQKILFDIYIHRQEVHTQKMLTRIPQLFKASARSTYV